MLTIIWIAVILANPRVCDIIVTINNSGDNSSLCCTDGTCKCSSLYDALSSITNNTVINITSRAVSLHNPVYIAIGSRSINNITIMSNNGATVMCNNTGTVSCYICTDVTLQGITWNQCGDPKNPQVAGIAFTVVTNIFIINCTFQEFKICNSVFISRPAGVVNILNSKFMFNMILDASLCKEYMYNSLLIYSQHPTCGNRLTVTINGSLFYHNGSPIKKDYVTISGSLVVYLICIDSPSSFSNAYLHLSILIKNTNFISNNIKGLFIYDTSVQTEISFRNVNISDNNEGMHVRAANGSQILFHVESSRFSFNRNGAMNLHFLEKEVMKVALHNTVLTKNKGIGNTHGTALNIMYYTPNIGICNISFCNFVNNIGGNSIVHISVIQGYLNFPKVFNCVFITSSNFTSNKIGSALHITKCFLKFYSTSLFEHNSAKSGAAIYIARASQITVDDGSTVQFVNNTASLHGGAMYLNAMIMVLCLLT